MKDQKFFFFFQNNLRLVGSLSLCVKEQAKQNRTFLFKSIALLN